MKLTIYNRDYGDRLGANITSKICQFIYAHKNNYSMIHESNTNFSESIFTKTLLEMIDKYKNDNDNNHTSIYNNDFNIINMNVVVNVQLDLLSYFNKFLKREFFEILSKYALQKNYVLPENWDNITCLHLRLEDVHNRIDYDGKYSANFFIDKINNDINNYSTTELYNYYVGNNLHNSLITDLSLYNAQAPISDYKILSLIEDYKLDNVKIVTSKNSHITLPFEVFVSDDADYDLWLMINAKNLILSKSTYALTSAYFFQGEQIFCPNWGHFASLGLGSKYDNTNFKYFY